MTNAERSGSLHPRRHPDDAQSSPVESLSMSQIERFISELTEEIASGLVPDKALIDRGIAASDRLKSLMTFIADHGENRRMAH
jgi:hypothetical protein